MSTDAAATSAPGVTVKSIPDPDEPVPQLSIPAVGLLVGGLALFGASTWLAAADVWPWPISVPISAAASYMLFTVSHDASHHSLSTSAAANTWLGRLATAFFAPHAGFRTWRFIHMQHHRFTNHHDGTDPDDYTNRGPAWQRPLRWLTIDLYYMVFYLPKLGSRPRGERIELFSTWLVIGAACIAATVAGYGFEVLVLYFLPLRLTILWLGFAFDYLPHNQLHHKPSEDRYKTTRNRIGMERLLSPLMLYQNYHLVHHLHPLVPFHRYLAVWRKREDEYLAGEPALTTVGGRPITPEEYRKLRELAEHA